MTRSSVVRNLPRLAGSSHSVLLRSVPCDNALCPLGRGRPAESCLPVPHKPAGVPLRSSPSTGLCMDLYPVARAEAPQRDSPGLGRHHALVSLGSDLERLCGILWMPRRVAAAVPRGSPAGSSDSLRCPGADGPLRAPRLVQAGRRALLPRKPRASQPVRTWIGPQSRGIFPRPSSGFPDSSHRGKINGRTRLLSACRPRPHRHSAAPCSIAVPRTRPGPNTPFARARVTTPSSAPARSRSGSGPAVRYGPARSPEPWAATLRPPPAVGHLSPAFRILQPLEPACRKRPRPDCRASPRDPLCARPTGANLWRSGLPRGRVCPGEQCGPPCSQPRIPTKEEPP